MTGSGGATQYDYGICAIAFLKILYHILTLQCQIWAKGLGKGYHVTKIMKLSFDAPFNRFLYVHIHRKKGQFNDENVLRIVYAANYFETKCKLAPINRDFRYASTIRN